MPFGSVAAAVITLRTAARVWIVLVSSGLELHNTRQ
jgi:hypothetical protein